MIVYNSTKNIIDLIGDARIMGIDVSEVIYTCDQLSRKIDFDLHLSMFENFGISRVIATDYLSKAKEFLSAEHLQDRVNTELAHLSYNVDSQGKTFSLRAIPVGTILHIGASNADALSAFSVIEGLLTGNINLVKLPKEDVFSYVLIEELIKINPKLSNFIFLFDVPSSDSDSMKSLVNLADLVAVWGSDSAVKGVRELCPANVKIVEWGHKISFAYATNACTDEDLKKVAVNMCKTNGLFCSSCQGIYYDTNDMNELRGFAKRFVGILRTVYSNLSSPNVFIDARKTLEFYTEKLESIFCDKMEEWV